MQYINIMTDRRNTIIVILLAFLMNLSACNDSVQQVSNPPQEEKDPFAIAATLPSSNFTNVPQNTNIVFTFNYEIDQSSVDITGISINEKVSDKSVAFEVKVLDIKSITLKITEPLLANTAYRVTFLPDAIKDINGKQIAENYIFDFATGNGVDEEPPIALMTTPGRQAPAPVNTNITLQFSEAVDIYSINVSLNDQNIVKNGQPIDNYGVSYTPDTLQFNITLPTLEFNKLYMVSLSETLSDTAGNTMAAPVEWTFTTEKEVDTTPPTAALFSPSSLSDVSLTPSIIINFSEPVDASSINVTLNAGLIVERGQSTGLGYDASFFENGTSLSISTPTLTENSSYTLSLVSGFRDIAQNASTETVTWTFITGAAIDTVPPSAIVTIKENSTNVLRPTITVQFFEAVVNETVNIDITDNVSPPVRMIGSGIAQNGYIVSPMVNNSLDIQPLNDLAPSTEYKVTILAGFTDLSNNSSTSDISTIFTSAPAPDTTAPTPQLVSPATTSTSLTPTIVIEFIDDNEIDPTTLTARIKDDTTVTDLVVAGTIVAPQDYRVSIGPNTLIATTPLLRPLTQYTVTIQAGLADSSMNHNATSANVDFAFTTGQAPDITAPAVFLSNPSTSPTLLSPAIVIAFNEYIVTDTLNVELDNVPVVVAGKGANGFQANYQAPVLTITVAAPLAEHSSHSLTVLSGLSDTSSPPNLTNNATTFNFVTGGPPAANFAVQKYVDPASGNSVTRAATNFLLTFSDAIDINTLNITLTEAGQPAVDILLSGAISDASSYSATITDTEVNIIPVAQLNYASSYTLEIAAGLTDLPGNATTTKQSLTFKTESAPNTAAILDIVNNLIMNNSSKARKALAVSVIQNTILNYKTKP